MRFSVRLCFSKRRDFTDTAEDRDVIFVQMEYVRRLALFTHSLSLSAKHLVYQEFFVRFARQANRMTRCIPAIRPFFRFSGGQVRACMTLHDISARAADPVLPCAICVHDDAAAVELTRKNSWLARLVTTRAPFQCAAQLPLKQSAARETHRGWSAAPSPTRISPEKPLRA